MYYSASNVQERIKICTVLFTVEERNGRVVDVHPNDSAYLNEPRAASRETEIYVERFANGYIISGSCTKTHHAAHSTYTQIIKWRTAGF